MQHDPQRDELLKHLHSHPAIGLPARDVPDQLRNLVLLSILVDDGLIELGRRERSGANRNGVIKPFDNESRGWVFFSGVGKNCKPLPQWFPEELANTDLPPLHIRLTPDKGIPVAARLIRAEQLTKQDPDTSCTPNRRATRPSWPERPFDPKCQSTVPIDDVVTEFVQKRTAPDWDPRRPNWDTVWAFLEKLGVTVRRDMTISQIHQALCIRLAPGEPTNNPMITSIQKIVAAENISEGDGRQPPIGQGGVSWQDAQKKIEEHVKAHGNVMPSDKYLAETVVRCSRATVKKAIDNSTTLRARRAERDAETRSFREVPMTDAGLDDAAQTREGNPSDLAALIDEQNADIERDERLAAKALRRRR